MPPRLEPGVRARLRAQFERRYGRTALSRSDFRFPLKLAKTFPAGPAGEALAVTVMDATPGLMNGDVYELDWHIGERCAVSATTQSYTKIHPCPTVEASQTISIRVEAGGSFVYMPQPTIPYEGARYRSTVDVSLAEGARFLMADILTPGRTHRGELYRYDRLANDISVRLDGKYIASNRLLLHPGQSPFRGVAMIEEETHLGTLYAFGPLLSGTAADAVRESAAAACAGKPGIRFGVTNAVRYGLTAVVLGTNVWSVQQVLAAMSNAFVQLAGTEEGGSEWAWPLPAVSLS